LGGPTSEFLMPSAGTEQDLYRVLSQQSGLPMDRLRLHQTGTNSAAAEYVLIVELRGGPRRETGPATESTKRSSEEKASTAHHEWCAKLVAWRRAHDGSLPKRKSSESEEAALAMWLSRVQTRRTKALGGKPSERQLTEAEVRSLDEASEARLPSTNHLAQISDPANSSIGPASRKRARQQTTDAAGAPPRKRLRMKTTTSMVGSSTVEVGRASAALPASEHEGIQDEHLRQALRDGEASALSEDQRLQLQSAVTARKRLRTKKVTSIVGSTDEVGRASAGLPALEYEGIQDEHLRQALQDGEASALNEDQRLHLQSALTALSAPPSRQRQSDLRALCSTWGVPLRNDKRLWNISDLKSHLKDAVLKMLHAPRPSCSSEEIAHGDLMGDGEALALSEEQRLRLQSAQQLLSAPPSRKRRDDLRRMCGQLGVHLGGRTKKRNSSKRLEADLRNAVTTMQTPGALVSNDEASALSEERRLQLQSAQTVLSALPSRQRCNAIKRTCGKWGLRSIFLLFSLLSSWVGGMSRCRFLYFRTTNDDSVWEWCIFTSSKVKKTTRIYTIPTQNRYF
jgi:hypothetical protein